MAWCTGDRAGLGHAPAPRGAVLGLFQDDARADGPQCLVVTDVAAEGLDLRRAARVVHYDLPWTPMRLEQREGRAVRLGSARPSVDVVRFEPPPVLDAALKLGAGLARKASLPARAGLGAKGVRLWRWRSELADRVGDGPGAAGTAAVQLTTAEIGPGILAGYELHAVQPSRSGRLAAVVGWLDAGGRWVEEDAIVTARVLAALRSEVALPADRHRISAALDRLAGPIRAHLARVGVRRWTTAEPEPAARALAVRLGGGVREAARRRDGALLARLERALAFAAGGHTAGEALLVRRLAAADPRELTQCVGTPAGSHAALGGDRGAGDGPGAIRAVGVTGWGSGPEDDPTPGQLIRQGSSGCGSSRRVPGSLHSSIARCHRCQASSTAAWRVSGRAASPSRRPL